MLTKNVFFYCVWMESLSLRFDQNA